jgi:phosphoribosyl 1,2-cyclic phosphodiesterase
MKRIRFWGTRGSLPSALTAAKVRKKLITALRGASGRTFASEKDIEDYVDGLTFPVAGTYGGHTSCVEIGPAPLNTCSAIWAACVLGQSAARHGPGSPRPIFMSHVHWDHIMGLPFFTPAYIPGNRLVIYARHPRLEAALRRQQNEPSFPVDFSILRADIEFVHLKSDTPYEVAGMTVTTKLQLHTGDSYGYRFAANGQAVVYSTDSEHKLADPQETEGFVDFFKNADLVIFDGMFSLADAISIKEDWGHSSNMVGVELCQMAGVRHLCLFHHDPAADDEAIERALADARRLEEITRTGKPMIVTAAYDGMEIEL